MSDPSVKLAKTETQIARCHPVVRELRPHHAGRPAFVRQVRRQQVEGFELAYLEDEGQIRAVAGFRVMEMLVSGRTLYIDDLVTRAVDRSRGFGGVLFDWLVAEARRRGCKFLTLDSGVQRFDAHRFYLTKRMQISSHHFALAL